MSAADLQVHQRSLTSHRQHLSHKLFSPLSCLPLFSGSLSFVATGLINTTALLHRVRSRIMGDAICKQWLIILWNQTHKYKSSKWFRICSCMYNRPREKRNVAITPHTRSLNTCIWHPCDTLWIKVSAQLLNSSLPNRFPVYPVLCGRESTDGPVWVRQMSVVLLIPHFIISTQTTTTTQPRKVQTDDECHDSFQSASKLNNWSNRS